MTAKEKHKANMLRYLGNPENDIPSRTVLAAVVGIARDTMYKAFTPTEIGDIYREALEIRRKQYAPEIAKIDKAMILEAKMGDTAAAKLCYQRLEGWSEKQAHEITGAGGGPVDMDFTINFVEKKK